jgi:uncharacterized NAD(P)/FAD-binding protein YdhS
MHLAKVCEFNLCFTGIDFMTDIAIIGGGAAGAAVFGELLRRNQPCTIHWIVNQRSLGRGVAYSTLDERHLLNVRAAGMGLFLDHSDDFLRHASGELDGVNGSDFLPRRLFGDFVQAQIAALIHSARQQGQSFKVHKAAAVGISAGPHDGYVIALADGRVIEAGNVVLALGSLPPRPLRSVSGEALASSAYKLDPWAHDNEQKSPRRVLVIGTGLTAVDTLLSASTRWPAADLVAVSRHGLLPFVHPEQPMSAFPFQAELNQGLLESDGVPAMVRRVRKAIAAHSGDWRSIVDGMRPINARLWQQLTHRQRKQFLRHVRWVWEASRHRLAPASAQAIEQLRDEGRLQVHSARVLRVEGSSPLRMVLRSRASQLISTLESDLVIQATGLDTALAYTEHELLCDLLERGLAVADPLQLGVVAQEDGQLINASGKPQRGLFAIGSLLRGSLWECTAMPEIRKAAHRVATGLSEDLVSTPTVNRGDGGASN